MNEKEPVSDVDSLAEDAQYTPDSAAVEQEEIQPEPEQVISWQASEYVHHDKTGKWYAAVLLVVIALSATVLFTHQWLSVGVFVMMAVAVIVYAKRPPRTLTYTLDGLGVHIEGKTYPYEQFSSFGVLQDADWHTVDLEPNQRFMPRLSLLYNEADYDAIVARLEAELPRADRTPDVVERITHMMKF